ncbi:XdhC family protein [Paracoccus sp. PAR01]|uniref:XdhC family protein n=1 Tax=Paracoccus sp. PAR01 TaxID=2769282 RepID=UPI001786FF8F|nr:XdhC family protein [Paracoccus sp. PAR01]MBD9525624.1 XdhC family protein [Paracoccus sp. PAR01]
MKDDSGPNRPTDLTDKVRASDLPLSDKTPAAMAFIVGVDGPSYRPVGACMVLDGDGGWRGSLSSGCIDRDIGHHAAEVARSGQSRLLRYGAGSPFRDLELPCGGGLDIRILPAPSLDIVARLAADMAARRPLRLWIGKELRLIAGEKGALELSVLPDPRFAVFGKGPEALAFARMTSGAGYDTTLASPDPETLAGVGAGAVTVRLGGAASLKLVPVDAYTAGVVFFHDHDDEPAILRQLLAGPAFYIGAQGSRRAAAHRLEVLRGMGVSEHQLARLRGPIGLIPSTRDPRTLAASVLAEVLAEASKQ